LLIENELLQARYAPNFEYVKVESLAKKYAHKTLGSSILRYAHRLHIMTRSCASSDSLF
jgi:hypothetical protein